MKAVHLGMGAVLAIMLGGCGFNLLPAVDISVTSNPSDLSYAAKTDATTGVTTYTLTPNQLVFTAQRGSLGMTVETFKVEFRDSSGQPITPGDNSVSGNVGVTVGPGLSCPGSTTTATPCDLSSKDVQYVTGAPTASVPVNLMSADMAVANYAAWQHSETRNGWGADVTFSGTASNGMKASFTKRFNVAILTASSNGGLQ